jgi:hypothetical protein
MGIQVRNQGGLCASVLEGCMCASVLWICWETGGSLWDNMALERSALARPLIATLCTKPHDSVGYHGLTTC